MLNVAADMADMLWLSVNPSFVDFHKPLLHELAQDSDIAHWEYSQTQDEPCSLEKALVLLHDYLKNRDRKIHLIGHSTGGLLGLRYARRHPERVQSLTLLSVGVNPTVDWQAHYYVQRQLLPCSRSIVMAQMVRNLFGAQSCRRAKGLIKLLERDLATSPSPHSLLRREHLSPGRVQVPLLVCGGDSDLIVDTNQINHWRPWLKECDRIWHCPNGRHFFHAEHPQAVGLQIRDFWQSASVARPVKQSVA